MTDENIIKILKDKSGKNINYINYFVEKFFKNDKRVYKRRSFDNLFIYFRKYKVSEKQLLKCLINYNFNFGVCTDINKIIIIPPFSFEKISNLKIKWRSESWYTNYTSVRNSKYTVTYIENLLEKIKNDKS